jgi:hypothetical protein
MSLTASLGKPSSVRHVRVKYPGKFVATTNAAEQKNKKTEIAQTIALTQVLATGNELGIGRFTGTIE